MASCVSSLREPKESVNSYHPDGPASYLDLRAHSLAKYPAPDKKRTAKKMPEVPRKKARMNLTLDLLQKEGKKQSTLDHWLFKKRWSGAYLSRTSTPRRDHARQRVGPRSLSKDFHTWWALFPKTPRNETADGKDKDPRPKTCGKRCTY